MVFRVLDITRAIACDKFLSDFNYGNLRSLFAATIPTLLVL